MKYILSSSDDSIGIGSIMIFDKDLVESVSHKDGFILTLKDGTVYQGYDCVVLGFEVKYVEQEI